MSIRYADNGRSGLPSGWTLVRELDKLETRRSLGCLSVALEKPSDKPYWRHEDVRRVGEKRWLVALDQVSQPGESKGSWDQEKADDPVIPDDENGRESDRNRDHVQGTIHRMVMRTVIM